MNEINTYLTQLSKQLCCSKDVTDKIDNSYNYLEGKIFEHFRDRIEKVQIFGSYDRGTYLPQTIDPYSDVDVMIVFKTNEFQPDTFLKHLREFAHKIYPRSEVSPDHPAITVILQHTKFELVPAYFENSFWNGEELKIPAPRNKELKWITTDHLQLKKDLNKKNERENRMLIPLVKFIKYFNSLNGKLFNSFLIEEFAINRSYPENELKYYLFEFINDLNTKDLSEEQIKFVQELKIRRKNLITLEKGNMPEYAIQELQKFLPYPC
ncbi:MAG: nucleotidyltransferase domain-containing protein [Vicingaceae bacterium]|nr:nucleotidyltransferase domain-containing protein [Vicingaceae bacterium]